jgi:ABC-type Co2+ transport system permease subunit
VTGLLIAALLFPIAGCIAGRRPLVEAFLFGLGVVGASLFVLGVFHVPFWVTIALVLIAGLAGFVWAPALSRPVPAGGPAPTLTNMRR